MGGGKGGGGGAGDMLQYGNKALDLQKQIYEENKGLIQPYYQAGTTGLNELMMRLGLSGSPSAQAATRENLVKQYMPQFTTQSMGGGANAAAGGYTGLGGRQYSVTPFGQGYSIDGPGGNVVVDKNYQIIPGQVVNEGGRASQQETLNNFLLSGWRQPQTTSTTDYNALNSYVDKLLAEQGAAAQANPNYGSLLSTYTGQDIYNDPSYKFRFDQGQKAAERALAASGKYLAPAGIQALQTYGQEMGSQEFQNAYNRFTNDQSNIYNRLANIAGLGQTATGQLAGVGTNYANAGTDLYTGMGNAITAANQAKAANRSSMFGTLLGTGAKLGAAYLASDPALKDNIKLMGQENGHNIYEFTYKDDPTKTRYIGVMADEILKTNPDAISEVGGYMAVDYNKIGVKFREADRAA